MPGDGDHRRHAFRVSIGEGSGVGVQVRKNGTAPVCKPRDISLVGMRAGLEARAMKHLAPRRSLA